MMKFLLLSFLTLPLTVSCGSEVDTNRSKAKNRLKYDNDLREEKKDEQEVSDLSETVEVAENLSCIQDSSSENEFLLVKTDLDPDTGLTKKMTIKNTFDDLAYCMAAAAVVQEPSKVETENTVTDKKCYKNLSVDVEHYFLVNDTRSLKTGLSVGLEVINEFTAEKYCTDNLK